MAKHRLAGSTLAFLVLLFVGSASAVPQWPMFQYERQRTGRCPWTGPLTPDTAWSCPAGGSGGPYRAPVVGSDGTVYFIPYQDSLHAFGPDGVLKWTYAYGALGGACQNPALDSMGRIYFTVEGNRLACVEDSTVFARLRWVSDSSIIPNGNCSPLVSATGCIYAGGAVSAFWPDGRMRWRTSQPSIAVTSGVAMSPDESWMVTRWSQGGPPSDLLRAIDTAGQETWIRPSDQLQTFGLPAVGADGAVHVTTAYRYLLKRFSTGELAWRCTLQSQVPSTPMLDAGDTVYVTAGDGLHKISPSGQTVWIDSAIGGSYFSPIQAGDQTIYCGNNMGQVFAVRPDGTSRWMFQGEGAFDGGAALDAMGRLIAVSNRLYCIGPSVFKDIALQSLAALPDTVDSGSVVTPQVVVQNNSGFTVVWIPVALKIGSLIQQIDTIPCIRPGDSTVLTFRPCTLVEAGMNAVKCSTAAIRDNVPANDFKTDSIYVRVYTGVTEKEPPGAQPLTFTLNAVSPSSFRYETELDLALPMDCRVNLKVYGSTGTLVKALCNETRRAGCHVLRWNGTDDRGRVVPPGVYYCRLVAGSYEAAAKLVRLE